LGIEVPLLNASTVDELNSTFATASQQRIGAMVVHADPFFDSQREKIVALSAQHGIAGCYPWREYVQAGGLMSYGTNLPDLYRQAGAYAGRVLKGEKPADLPVMRPTKFELVLNTKTAKTLGVQIPQNLLAIADEVID
jgi:putative ABC transport system substrate-binding protein